MRRSTRPWSPEQLGGEGERERRACRRPDGPWKRYACAGPSASAARSSRFASCCSGTLSKAFTDLLRELLGAARSPSSSRRSAPGTCSRARGSRRRPARWKLGALALDAGRWPRGASRCDLGGSTQQRRTVQVGQQVAGRRRGSARGRARRRARARRPGRRATSRRSGRRRRPRRARAPARITLSTSSARAAAKSAASAQRDHLRPVRGAARRTRSPSCVPPGSRVATTSRPSARERVARGAPPASSCRTRRALRR